MPAFSPGRRLTALWGLASLVYLARPAAVLIVAAAIKRCRAFREYWNLPAPDAIWLAEQTRGSSPCGTPETSQIDRIREPLAVEKSGWPMSRKSPWSRGRKEAPS